MPNEGRFGQIKRCFRSLLAISEIVCDNAGLMRYQLGSDEHHSRLGEEIPKRSELKNRITISFDKLDAVGVEMEDIAPFIFHPHMKDELTKQKIGYSYLELCPLIINSDESLSVALPTALTVAARDYIIASIIEDGLVETFNKSLAENYARLFFTTPLMGGPMRAPVYWERAGEHQIASFMFEVDHGYYISYHLFLPSIQVHPLGRFKSVWEDDGRLTGALQKSINNALDAITRKDEFRQGLIVVVGCGWGKGYATREISVRRLGWRLQRMAAADLISLSWLDDMSPGYFWRIQDGLEAIEKGDVNIVNLNGILNLIGWVRSNDGHFVPHADLPEGEISPDKPLQLHPPTNLLREVRADSDRGYDRHHSIDNTGVRHNVQRVSPKPYFGSESEHRLYASIDEVDRGVLTTVYEGKAALWITIVAENITDRGLIVHLYRMANEWLHRIGNELDKCIAIESVSNRYQVYVEFHDADPPKNPSRKPTLEELISLCSVEEHEEPNACKAIFRAGFLNGYGLADNTAERLFARNLIAAYLRLFGMDDSEAAVNTIAETVVLNPQARSFHVFHAQGFIDYVRDSLPDQLVSIDKLDDAAAKIGLGWRAAEKGQGSKIIGRDSCTRFLGKVVDELIADILGRLKNYERITTLYKLVGNSEKATSDEDHWVKTSAAIIGLHGDQEDTINKCVEQISNFSGANIASRVLIEMALCGCPIGNGNKLSDIELSKLIARAALIVRIGGLSNAIYYNALTPEIAISPLGDILFKDDFGRVVVQPMLERSLGEKYISNAPHQTRNYEEPKVIADTMDKIESDFMSAWKVEMGFEIDEGRKIIDAMEDKGIAENTAVFSITREEFINLACLKGVEKEPVKKFLDQFALKTRERWDRPPDGFDIDDIEPWRFGRRLSFVARPILQVDKDNSASLVVAPNALRRGFGYIVAGAYKGTLKQSFFQSRVMKDDWWGKASEGHSFNAEVAHRLSGEGWETRENIGLPEILNAQIVQNYGDVDVLAWKEGRNDVLVIECKNLTFTRNYSELQLCFPSTKEMIMPKESQID